MVSNLKGAYQWSEGWGCGTIVNNAADSTLFICVLSLGVSRGTAIEDGKVAVGTELTKLFSVVVWGSCVHGVTLGLLERWWIILQVGEDVSIGVLRPGHTGPNARITYGSRTNSDSNDYVFRSSFIRGSALYAIAGFAYRLT